MSGTIALLTDFGTTDHYVGVMKGTILNICPHIDIIDITHDVAPGNVQQCCFLLDSSHRYFSKGTIFVAVVDPGVGSTRRPIVVNANDYLFIAPDNGILTNIIRENRNYEIRIIENAAYMLKKISRTFHGRDIFAPTAANIAAGKPFRAIGNQIDDPLLLSEGYYKDWDTHIETEILHIDKFGNIITAIPETFEFSDHRFHLKTENNDYFNIKIAGTFNDLAPEELGLIRGSSGRFEIALNSNSAAVKLKVKVSDSIRLFRLE